MEKSQRQVARAAALVMVAFAASRVLGLVRQVVFGFYFGTGPEMDAYTFAQRVPEAIFFVVAGGALGSAFIPLFTTRMAKGKVADAWRLVSSLINILIVILVPLILLCILIAPWLVRTLVAPAALPEVQIRAAELMRVMLLSTVIFGISGVVMGALNAQQHFLLPAIAPLLYNLAIIGGAIVGGTTQLGMMGPAIGAVVGALGHLLVQLPGLRRHSAQYTPTLGLADSGVREVGLLMAPRVLGVAAVQFNMVVTNNLASRLHAGAASALDFGWRVVLLPQGVFAHAIGIAAFPTFSTQAARGELEALSRTLMATLRTIIAVTLPASVGLVMLGQSIVAMMFQRGAFDVDSTRNVTWALGFFAVGLVGLSAIEVLARAFYAFHDTWTPAFAAVVAVALNFVLGLILPSVLERMGMPALGGLALANALASLVEMAILLALIHRRLGGFDVRALGGLTLKVSLASAGMGLVLWGWLWMAPANIFVQAGLGVVFGVAAYAVLAWLLHIDELKQAVMMVLRR